METRVKFSVMSAMMEKSRGIGNKGLLPWPHIKKDYEFYTTLVTQRKDSAKKNIFIMGRLTWDGMPELMKKNETINIVISKTLRVKPEFCWGLATDFENALKQSQKLYNAGEVETVWILGGQRVYTEAVHHPSCEKVYLTRVYKEYPCDTYFPVFEKNYDIVSKSEIEQEVDGIELQFFVYTPKKC